MPMDKETHAHTDRYADGPMSMSRETERERETETDRETELREGQT